MEAKIESAQPNVEQQEKRVKIEVYPVKGMEFSDEKIKKAWEEDKPLQVGLAFPANRCNADCIYCYTKENRYMKKAGDKSLSIEQIYGIIEEAKRMGCKRIMMGGYGEPLMNDEFWPILDKARELSLDVMIFTNATLIDKTTAKRFKDYDVSFMIKLNSRNEEKQNILLGRPGSGLAKKLYDGIDNLIEEKFNQPDRKGQTRLGIHLGICKFTEEDIPQVFKWALDRKIFPFIEELFPGGAARIQENIELLGTDKEISEVIYPRVVKQLKEKFPTTNQSIFGEGSCKMETISVMLETFSGKGIKCFTRNEDDIGNYFDNNNLQGIWDKNRKERKDEIEHGCAGCKGRKCAREKNAQCPFFRNI